jgi:hypothetical protein
MSILQKKSKLSIFLSLVFLLVVSCESRESNLPNASEARSKIEVQKDESNIQLTDNREEDLGQANDTFPRRVCRDPIYKETQVFNVLLSFNLLRERGVNIFDYCRSFKPGLEKDLVAQFTSLDRAKEFSSLFQQDDVDIEIQEELIKVQNENQPEVAQASQLEPDQVEALLEVDKNNPKSFEFKIVVPTYIPDGFQLVSLDLDNARGIGDPSYELLYEHRDGRCFSLRATSGGLGAGVADGEIIQADSLILGQVNIILLKPDRIPGDSIMMWPTPSKILGAQYYQFTSGRGCKQVISLAESKKIVESLRYLNPDT